jgi:sec-independent protein translocase protein TatA
MAIHGRSRPWHIGCHFAGRLIIRTAIKGEKRMFEGLFQPMHLIIVLGIALLFFGPKKLPELGKGLGEAIRGFKKGINEINEKEDEAKGAVVKEKESAKN